jgi:uncharacterized cupredoxin-like copper-binding protein
MRSNVRIFWYAWVLGILLTLLAACAVPPGDLDTDETGPGGVIEPTLALPDTGGTEAAPEIPDTGVTQGAVTEDASVEEPTETGASPGGAETETAANTVQVALSEYVIDMPTSVPAGQTVFEVTNAGTEEHSFEIHGQGVDAELVRDLQPGETLTLEVTLEPGVYEIFCPVSDHASEGMRLDLTVTEP